MGALFPSLDSMKTNRNFLRTINREQNPDLVRGCFEVRTFARRRLLRLLRIVNDGGEHVGDLVERRRRRAAVVRRPTCELAPFSERALNSGSPNRFAAAAAVAAGEMAPAAA